MSVSENDDIDFEQYDFGPPSGFPLPPAEGYDAAREWLALTYDGEEIVSASLVEALDPCVLAQTVNLERWIASGGGDQSPDACYQEGRILMELGEIDMVWRVESSLGGIRTTVQPSDHPDAVEDMEMHGGLVATRKEPCLRLPALPAPLPMSEVMTQCRAIGALVEGAMEHSESYADAMVGSRIGMTWGGLADAVGLAETVFPPDDPFLAEYRSASARLAESLRPNSSVRWHARKDEFRLAVEEKRRERMHHAVAA